MGQNKDMSKLVTPKFKDGEISEMGFFESKVPLNPMVHEQIVLSQVVLIYPLEGVYLIFTSMPSMAPPAVFRSPPKKPSPRINFKSLTALIIFTIFSSCKVRRLGSSEISPSYVF